MGPYDFSSAENIVGVTKCRFKNLTFHRITLVLEIEISAKQQCTWY